MRRIHFNRENILGKVRNTIKTKPFFWLLVPLFFLLKNADTYFSAIPGTTLLLLSVRYIAASCILYLILFLFLKKRPWRVALYCFVLLTVYYFYSSFDQFLQEQQWLYPFSRYRWSLPFLGLFVLATLFFIYRLRSKPESLFSFLNLLMILFCSSEGIGLLYKLMSPQSPLLTIKKDESFSHYAPAPVARPDIYFLLFDEYQGNAGLQKVFNYNNDRLRNVLTGKGFFSPALARSNYNYTFFSIPSILNMDYLQGEVQGKDRARDLMLLGSGTGLIRNSRIIEFLKTVNYSIVNLSPFQLDDTGDKISKFKTINVGNDLVNDQTLFNTLKGKFGWMTDSKRLLRLLDPSDYNFQFYNEYVRQHLLVRSASSHKDPRFVYAHFFIPHAPFLKDSSGNDLNFRLVIQNGRERGRDYLYERYLDYLKYASTVMINTTDTLLRNDPGAIILIMSDHGFRGLAPEYREFQYNIQFYIRTPEKNYSAWPDTVDAVNVFRLLLNNEFGQKLGYLPYRIKEFQLPTTVPPAETPAVAPQ